MPLPSWVREWLHPTRNARTTLSASDDDDDDASSWKIFQCPKAADHVWCARPADLAARGPKAACPCCALIQVSSTNCVKTTHPAIAEEWHPTKNGRHVPSPRETLSSAKAAVWFRCRRNDRHEWRAVVANRCAGEPCPFCAGKVALPFTTLVARLGRDLVYYFWHKRKNQNPPDQILSGADVPIRLKDPLTGTEWTTTPELLCQVAESVTYGGNAKEAIYSRFVSREERSRALALLKTALGRAESYLIDTILEDAFLAAGVPVTLRDIHLQEDEEDEEDEEDRETRDDVVNPAPAPPARRSSMFFIGAGRPNPPPSTTTTLDAGSGAAAVVVDGAAAETPPTPSSPPLTASTSTLADPQQRQHRKVTSRACVLS